jgi:hypothetical protein
MNLDVFWRDLEAASTPWGIRPPPPYKYKVHDQLRCSTHTIIIKINLHPLFYPLFPSTSPCSRGAIWTVDQWWRSSRAARPARATHSRCTPWQGPSRARGVSSLKIPHWHVLRITLLARFLRWRVLQIALIARGTRSECEYPLGSGRPKSWLGPTSSDLAPYQCGDLIKHQYTSARLLGPQMISNKNLSTTKLLLSSTSTT